MKPAEALDNVTEAVIADVAMVDGDDVDRLEFPDSDPSMIDEGKDMGMLVGDGLGNGVEGVKK